MISCDPIVNDQSSCGLVKNLPKHIFEQLGRTLNKEGPCNWQALQRVFSEKNISFGPEENDKLLQCPPADSSVFLSIVWEKGISTKFLLDCLRLLPCLCSWRVLHNHLNSNLPALPLKSTGNTNTSPHNKSTCSTNTSPHKNTSNTNTSPHNTSMHPREFASASHVPRAVRNNWTPLSLPSDFVYSGHADCDVITEHPKDSQVKIDALILLRCSVKQSCHAKFQWFHMFRSIEGQTSHMLMIPHAQVSDEGYYCCRVTHAQQVRSRWAYVAVGPKESKCFASDKVALLIANERYNHHKHLPAAPCDIQELTQILQNELNFKTFSFVNLTFTEIHRALKWLCEMAKDGCYCVFYFGGHGYENDGKCYMVPVDAPLTYDNSHCINVHTELEDIQRRCTPSLLLILLDICRKRNTQVKSNAGHRTSFLPNVVLAYATMESREAFERRGEKHGVFVECLRKHLAKPKIVTHMLIDVQTDVRTSGVQVSEVRTTLTEERRLSDPIRPRNGTMESHTKWMDLHGMVRNKPLTAEFGRDAQIQLRYRSILTNKIEITLDVSYIDSTKYRAYWAYFELDKTLPFNVDLMPEIVSHHPFVMRLSNLQRVKGPLVIKIVFQCESKIREGKLYQQIYKEKLNPSFFNYWSSSKNDHFFGLL